MTILAKDCNSHFYIESVDDVWLPLVVFDFVIFWSLTELWLKQNCEAFSKIKSIKAFMFLNGGT